MNNNMNVSNGPMELIFFETQARVLEESFVYTSGPLRPKDLRQRDFDS